VVVDRTMQRKVQFHRDMTRRNSRWNIHPAHPALLVLLGFLLLMLPARAQEVSPAPSSTEPPLEVSFYLQADYMVNINHPASGQNDLRIFDSRSDYISPDLAQAVLQRRADPGRVGFKLKLNAGETAKLYHAIGLGAPEDSFDVMEAFVTYTFPGSRGLKLTGGKMGTLVGAEVIEAINNPNYSPSFLYSYAQPATHTGIMAGYDFSPQLSANVSLVNGWDNFSDLNYAKTLGFNLVYAAGDDVSMSFSVLNGPEQDGNTTDNRFLFDWVGTFRPLENLTFLMNYDLGNEAGAALEGGTARWEGYSIIGKYDFSNGFSLALRGENFHDYDGVRTGTPQTLTEFTLSLTIPVNTNVFLRPEYRRDWSDVPSFDEGTRCDQGTYSLALMISL